MTDAIMTWQERQPAPAEGKEWFPWMKVPYRPQVNFTSTTPSQIHREFQLNDSIKLAIEALEEALYHGNQAFTDKVTVALAALRAQPAEPLVFGMRGPKMTFTIGNQSFTLDYEPETTDEYVFMGNMLKAAISKLPLGVKIGAQPAGDPPYGSKRKAAMAVYEPPFKFQRGYIFDSQQSMVADDDQVRGAVASRVRGWGKLSYLPNGAELQDEIGQMMADALNAYYAGQERAQPDHSELVKRLRIKSSMIMMGERIAWGSDTALMDEAANALECKAIGETK